MTEIVNGRIEAMEQGIANTCQSLNFELFTFTLTCLTHVNDKPKSDQTGIPRCPPEPQRW